MNKIDEAVWKLEQFGSVWNAPIFRQRIPNIQQEWEGLFVTKFLQIGDMEST